MLRFIVFHYTSEMRWLNVTWSENGQNRQNGGETTGLDNSSR